MKKISDNIVPHFLLEIDDIKTCIKPRDPESHKGTFGHGLLIAGKYGMAGAAILAARACMRSGIGKLTVHTQECNVPILQMTIPEAILDIEKGHNCFMEMVDDKAFSAVGIGCGLGTDIMTHRALLAQVLYTRKPLVIDADGLNILSEHKQAISDLPQNTILTPHHGELTRLIGRSTSNDEELRKVLDLTSKYRLIIVMKGHNTRIVTPDGKVYVNPTGNPGMATAGSGDVLTGIILSLLAQGYEPTKAACIGVYIHGLAGDIVSHEKGEVSILASDIVECLPKAFLSSCHSSPPSGSIMSISSNSGSCSSSSISISSSSASSSSSSSSSSTSSSSSS